MAANFQNNFVNTKNAILFLNYIIKIHRLSKVPLGRVVKFTHYYELT